jgi:hypothetical protein
VLFSDFQRIQKDQIHEGLGGMFHWIFGFSLFDDFD